jgi:hypothetical protein
MCRKITYPSNATNSITRTISIDIFVSVNKICKYYLKVMQKKTRTRIKEIKILSIVSNNNSSLTNGRHRKNPVPQNGYRMS